MPRQAEADVAKGLCSGACACSLAGSAPQGLHEEPGGQWSSVESLLPYPKCARFMNRHMPSLGAHMQGLSIVTAAT